MEIHRYSDIEFTDILPILTPIFHVISQNSTDIAILVLITDIGASLIINYY
jgi:hypothetical protein